MNDFLDDNRATVFLSGAELLASPLPQARKGGLDELAVRAALERAAVTIDGLGAHAARLEAENVRLTQAAEQASQDAARSQALLGAPAPVAESGVQAAAGLLASAERVAQEVRDGAEQDARATREAAEVEAEAIVAGAQARAEEVRARAQALEAEIEQARAGSSEEIEALRAQRDEAQAELEGQLSRYRELAGQVHLRAVGSLEAALATLNSYVAAVAEDDAGEGDDEVADEAGEGISDAWTNELADDDAASVDGADAVVETPGAEASVDDADEVVYVVEVTEEPPAFGTDKVVHETDRGVWVRSDGPIEDPGAVAQALSESHPFTAEEAPVAGEAHPADGPAAGADEEEVPPAPLWGPPPGPVWGSGPTS